MKHKLWASKDLNGNGVVKLWNKEPRKTEHGSFYTKEYMGYSCEKVWQEIGPEINPGECTEVYVSFTLNKD